MDATSLLGEQAWRCALRDDHTNFASTVASTAVENDCQVELSDQNFLTELRRDSSFFGGTFGAEREFDRTLAKTEAPTELAQLVIVSRRTLTTSK